MRSKLHREEGAAAVEFALVVSLLVMLIFGMMEYGLAFWQIQNLRAAAREGARVAAVRGTSAQISTAMSNASAGSIPPGYTGYTVTHGNPPVSGSCTRTTVGQETKVTITNSALGSSVQSAFTIEVPFLPTVTLNPTLSGSFRCE